MAEEKTEAAQRRSESRPEASKRDEPDDFTHYVHLADGSVRKHTLTEPLGSHYPDDGDAHGGIAIIGIYPR